MIANQNPSVNPMAQMLLSQIVARPTPNQSGPQLQPGRVGQNPAIAQSPATTLGPAIVPASPPGAAAIPGSNAVQKAIGNAARMLAMRQIVSNMIRPQSASKAPEEEDISAVDPVRLLISHLIGNL